MNIQVRQVPTDQLKAIKIPDLINRLINLYSNLTS